MEDLLLGKEYPCQHCHSRKAKWICLLDQDSGQRHVKLYCPSCSFTTVPQMKSTVKLTMLQELNLDSSNEGPECRNPLLPTGQANTLKSQPEENEEPKLIGVFFEMRCPRCGFLIDIGVNEVKAATVSYPHPNRNYR